MKEQKNKGNYSFLGLIFVILIILNSIFDWGLFDKIKEFAGIEKPRYDEFENQIFQNPDYALDIINGLIMQKPDRPDGYMQRARVYIVKEEYSSALIDLEKSLQLDGSLFDAHYYKGCAYYFLNSIDDAINEFNIAIDMNAKNVSSYCYYYRACSRKKKGQLNGALSDLYFFINNDKLNKDDKKYAYFERGLIYIDLNDCENAIKDFSLFLSIIQEDKTAYLYLGKAEYLCGKYEAAMNDLNTALDYPESNYWMGKIYLYKNQKETALKYFENAVNKGDTNSVKYIKDLKINH
jgi:tetratricopeptide (TPR) repeat protein